MPIFAIALFRRPRPEPTPYPKGSGQCAGSYVQSGGFCAPKSGGTVREAIPRGASVRRVGPNRAMRARRPTMTMRQEWMRAGDRTPACWACFMIFDDHVEVLAVTGPNECMRHRRSGPI